MNNEKNIKTTLSELSTMFGIPKELLISRRWKGESVQESVNMGKDKESNTYFYKLNGVSQIEDTRGESI